MLEDESRKQRLSLSDILQQYLYILSIQPSLCKLVYIIIQDTMARI